MAGGVVSGGNGLLNNGDRNSPIPSIIVPTVLRITKDAIQTVTGVTCLYDRYWTPSDRSEMVTLPICFFHIKKITEVMNTSISNKRIMLYESQQNDVVTAEYASDMLRPSVMNIVADNAVKEPKAYNIEAILPFHPTNVMYSRSMNDLQQLIMGLMEVTGLLNSPELITYIRSVLAAANLSTKALATAGGVGGILPDDSGIATINKNSLDAMWQSSRILTMKMWTGYHYKYVILKSCQIDKQPTEDDVFRVTMTVQEMPVLTVTRVTDASREKNERRKSIVVAENMIKRIIDPLVNSLRLKEASGEQQYDFAANITDPDTGLK